MVCVAALCAIALPDSAFAATHISDGTHISSSTEWTTANSPYILDGSAYVNSGVTLTIDAGVTVKFAGGHLSQFTINGTLDANGTSGSHVTLTSDQTTPAAGDWEQVLINGSATLDYTDVYYGGYGFADWTGGEVVVSDGGEAYIDHSVMEYSKTSGLLDGLGGASNAEAWVTHSTLSSNDDGVYVNNGYLSLTENNQVNSNANDGVAFSYNSTFTDSASDVSHNTISSNGRYGVLYMPVSGFVGGTNEPTGHENNIYSNSNYQLYDSQFEPTLDWTMNYWGTAYTYANPAPCQDAYAATDDHVEGSTLSEPAEGPVNWDEHDVKIQVSEDPPEYITYKCGWDYVEADPFETSLIDNSGL